MPELFKQLSIIIATLRDNFIAIRNENQELRKRYVSLQNEYDKLKNIDTIKEKIVFTNIDKKALPEIETEISTQMMKEKQKYGSLKNNK